MLAVSLGLLLVGSGVSVHLEELGEMPLEEASSFADRLAEAIEARTARRAVLDDPLWPECKEANRCIDAIRARTKTDDVVLLRLYSGPTKIRLYAERLSLDGLRDARLEENVPKERAEWGPPIDKLASQLFPEPPRPEEEAADVVSTTTVQESTGFFDVAPWVVLGAGGATLIVSGVFGLSWRSARSDLMEPNPDPEAFDDAFNRMQSHGRIATGLLIGGLAGLAAGGVLLMFAD
jgi:hypothetical protein